jgi:hypothetical protein
MRNVTIAILLFTTAIAVPAMAQTSHNNNKPWPVSVALEGSPDSVGKAFAYAIKEQLNRSTIFQYTTDTTRGLSLSILSLNDDGQGSNDNSNYSAAVSIVLVGKRKGEWDWFLDQWIMIVGKNRTDEMAKQVLTHVSYDMDQLQKLADSVPADNPQLSRN